jgi:serine/threonine protein kinase
MSRKEREKAKTKEKEEFSIFLPKPLNIREYELSKTIGLGSHSIIKLGKSSQSNKFYAIKKIKKSEIIELKLVQRLWNEIKSLSLAENLYIQKYQGFALDNKYIYIITELVTGGSLYDKLRKEIKFSFSQALNYSAQIVIMIEAMHSKNIIYRDLRPEKLLFDHKGFLKLIDFGLAKVCEGRTYTVCGIPEYLAPEVLLNIGHGKEVDWWSFGCILYEFLVGLTPFYENDPILIFKRILKGDVKFPSEFPPSAKSLIKHCLERDISKRYGCLSRGVGDIKGHRFFVGFDWNGCAKHKGKKLYVPVLKSMDELSLLNFINDEEDEAHSIIPEEDPFEEWIKKKN